VAAKKRQSDGAPAVAPRSRWGASAVAVAVTAAAVYAPKLPFTTPYTPRFAGILLAAAVWAWAVALAPAAFRGRRRLLLAVAAVAAAAVASAAFSADPGAAFTFGAEDGLMGGPTWLALLGILAASSSAVLGRDVRTALTVSFIWAVPVALTVLLDVARGSWVSAGFGNPNFAGAVLVPFVPLALYLAREAEDSRVRLAWRAVAAVCAAAVVLCGSLAPVGALAVALGVLLLAAPQVVATPARSRLVRGTGAGLLAAAGLAGVIVVASLTTPALPSVRDALGPTAQTRVEMWRISAAVLAENPLLGVGPDGLQLASQGHLTERLLSLEAGGYTDYRLLLRDPHSLPALAGVSLGALGLAALLWLAVEWLLAFRSRLAAPGAGAGWRWALVAGVAGLLSAMLLMPWPIVFGGLIPLLAGLAVAPAPDRDGPAAEPAAARVWVARGVAVVVTVLAVALSGAAVLGDSHIASAQRATDAESAAQAYDSAARVQPTRSYPAYEALYARGVVLASAAPTVYRQLVDDAPQGVRLSGGYLADLTQPLLDRAAPEKAADLAWERATLERAAALAPLHPDVVLERAHLAAHEGNAEELARLLDLAERIGAGQNPRYSVYRYYLARLEGDRPGDEELAAQIRDRSPHLAPMLDVEPGFQKLGGGTF